MSAGAVRAGKAVVELGILDKTKKGLQQAQKRLRNFGKRISTTGRAIGALSLAAAAPIAFASKTFADFADKMATVGAVTQATQRQLMSLTDQSKLLGRTTSFTAAQVAGLQIELGRAGFNPAQIEAAAKSILSLGRATGTELATAANIAASTIRQFGLDAADSGMVADILAVSVNSSAQTLEDFGEAMKDLGPLAAETGLSLKEVATSVGLVANIGLRGSKAGTGIARALKELASSAKQAKLLKEFGVSALDADRNMRPLHEVLRDLDKATQSLGSGDRLAAFNELFGRGIVQASALSKSAGAFDEFIAKLDSATGKADEMALAMDDNIGGAFRRFMSAAEGIQIAVGEAIELPLGKLVDALSNVFNKFTTFIENNQALVVAVVAIITATGTLAAALLSAGVAAGVAAFAIGALATIVASPLALVGALTAALTVGGVAWLKYSDFGKKAMMGLSAVFDSLFPNIQKILAAIRKSITDGRLELAFEILGAGIEVAWTTFLNALITKLNGFIQAALNNIKVVAKAVSVLSPVATERAFARQIAGLTLSVGAISSDAAARKADAQRRLSELLNDPRFAEVRPPVPETTGDEVGEARTRERERAASLNSSLDALANVVGGGAATFSAGGAALLGFDMQGSLRDQTRELKKQTRKLEEIEDNQGEGGLGE